jgi:hypothetical protein
MDPKKQHRLLRSQGTDWWYRELAEQAANARMEREIAESFNRPHLYLIAHNPHIPSKPKYRRPM